MSSRLFITAIRLQLHEAAPGWPKRIVRQRFSFNTFHSFSLCLETPHGPAYTSICAPANRRTVGYAVTIEPPGSWKAVIYATKADILPLTPVVAKFLITPPVVPSLRYPDGQVTVWYTPSAGRECFNDDMNENGMLLEVDSIDPPSV